MTINFQSIKWRNFLSTGNQFTEIKLDKSTTTLIVGENGAGKSTILDALCFVLFGKAFRNINKPQLINSINNKDCLVEISFNIGSKTYVVRRGIKPNIFTIHVNGELLNQDAASRDYQKVLEEQILKLNYKSFTQIVVLGSASFTPFMQLPLAHRREIIEDILDIQVFSTMNAVLKDKIQENKTILSKLEDEIELEKHKAKIQQDYIKKIETDISNKTKEIEDEIEKTNNEINIAQKAIDELTIQITEKSAEVDDQDVMSKKFDTVTKMLDKLKTCKSKLDSEIEFYHDNNECPTCKQGIAHGYKEEVIAQKGTKSEELTSAIVKLGDDIATIQTRLLEINKINLAIADLNKKVTEHNNAIVAGERYITKLRNSITVQPADVSNVEIEKQKLREIAKQVVTLSNQRSDLRKEQEYHSICSTLLKDTGIKTKIVKQYLPIINKMVNKYLTSMDFFVHFELDEAFNEVIKSRHRDEFSYASFSEGEKQRIDLSLLFTWRAIAKLKNSANTNLLILDEIFDSSLDNNGTEFVMELLKALGEETNLFVISHKGDQLFDKFRSVIRFEKIQNFSVLR